MYQHQTDASALKTCSQSLPHYFRVVTCGGRALFAVARAPQELGHDQVFIVQHSKSTCREQGSSSCEQRPTALGRCPECQPQVPTRSSTSSVWAHSPLRIYLGAEHKYQVLTAALEAAFSLICRSAPFCVG